MVDIAHAECKYAVVERRPLVLKALCLNPVMRKFCILDFFTQTTRVLVMSPGRRHQA